MKQRLTQRLRSLTILSDRKVIFIFALLVGIADGVVAALLIHLIEHVEFWTSVQASFGHRTSQILITILVPALGGLAAGWVIGRFDHAAEKTGVGEVIVALKLKQGFMSARLTLTKAIASALTVGSSAAVGPEAPIVQIGGGVGSLFAHLRHLPPKDRKILVAAGAAGGLAAIFNTPIAAVVFAVEVLIKEFASETLALIVLTTVTASVTTHVLMGQRTYFPRLNYSFNRPEELGFYLLLGILCAVTAKIFQAIYHSFEDLFEGWTSAARPIKTMIGGLLVGILGVYRPGVLWDGHLVVTQLLTGNTVYDWSIFLLFTLLVGKMIATSLSVTSGGSGGLMIPAMFMGAMTGVIFGRWVHIVFPASADPGAYGMIGMAAFLAGVTHGPFTAIMMLYELTGDYNSVLPLMFTVGITMLIARWLHAYNIEYRELKRKGVNLSDSAELRALENYSVEDVMGPPDASLSPHDTASVFPGTPLWDALRQMRLHGKQGLRVIDRRDPTKVLGSLHLNDVSKIYLQFLEGEGLG